VLDQLEEGQVAPAVVEQDSTFVVLQRLAPTALKPPPLSFDLPRPPHADMRHVISRLGGLSQLGLIRVRASELLDLDVEQAQKLAWLHDSERIEKEAAGQRSWTIYDDIQRQTRALLGPANYERYSDVLHQHFDHYLLAPETARGQSH
jgi:hypothetical protein